MPIERGVHAPSSSIKSDSDWQEQPVRRQGDMWALGTTLRPTNSSQAGSSQLLTQHTMGSNTPLGRATQQAQKPHQKSQDLLPASGSLCPATSLLSQLACLSTQLPQRGRAGRRGPFQPYFSGNLRNRLNTGIHQPRGAGKKDDSGFSPDLSKYFPHTGYPCQTGTVAEREAASQCRGKQRPGLSRRLA